MNNIIKFSMPLLIVMGIVGCQKSAFEEADLSYTNIYEVINPDNKAKTLKYSVYHEINSLLLWKNSSVISADLPIHDFNDLTSNEEYDFSFSTAQQQASVNVEYDYYVFAEKVGEQVDGGGYRGKLVISSQEKSDTIAVIVREAIKHTDLK